MTPEQIRSELSGATAMMASMYTYCLSRTQCEQTAYELARAACSGNWQSYQRAKTAAGVML